MGRPGCSCDTPTTSEYQAHGPTPSTCLGLELSLPPLCFRSRLPCAPLQSRVRLFVHGLFVECSFLCDVACEQRPSCSRELLTPFQCIGIGPPCQSCCWYDLELCVPSDWCTDV